jgi:hypothetical protein
MEQCIAVKHVYLFVLIAALVYVLNSLYLVWRANR